MGAKTDTLIKHEGHRKAKKDDAAKGVKKGESYLAKDCRHQKNVVLFARRQPQSILQQVNLINTNMRRKKVIQLATLFQVLASGRPMIEYEQREALYNFLHFSDIPRMHWTDSSGWLMAEFMYDVVKDHILAKVKGSNFVAISCDKVTANDSTSWLSIHAYICENWQRVPHLLKVHKVIDGTKADDLVEVLTNVMMERGGLMANDLMKKLVSFGADGAAVFQGKISGVATQLREKHAPYVQSMHCFIHRCNLAFKSLSQLKIMEAIERLLASTYLYFNKSPRRVQEFKDLAEVMESRGLKLLRNVQTRWISLLDPVRRLISQYRVVLSKMMHSKESESAALAVFNDMVDPSVLLGMMALIPLIETIDVLISFAQKDNVFIQDFVAALGACQAQLFTMYIDSSTAFSSDEFTNFRAFLELSHYNIFMRWDVDLNNQQERLMWKLHNIEVPAIYNSTTVNRVVFTAMAVDIKSQCKEAAAHLIRELTRRFPSVDTLNALGIVYPQYWA